METIKIKKLKIEAVIPYKGSDGAAAYDLSACNDTEVLQGRNIVKLGLALQLPKGFCAEIQPRSGYSSKGFPGEKHQGEFIVNDRFDADVLYGLIDEDYRGEIGVIINNRDQPFLIRRGQRIAQLVVRRCENMEFDEVENLESTERGTGGFGSTNI